MPGADGYDPSALHAAAVALASVCDGGRSADAAGYSGLDAGFGHQVAALPAARWDGDVSIAAWAMLRKYAGQLAGLGVNWQAVTPPPGAGDGRVRAARLAAKGVLRDWEQRRRVLAQSYVRCAGPGEPALLRFGGYDATFTAASKQIPGQVFDWARNVAVYPFTSLSEVIDLAVTFGIPVDDDVHTLAPAARAQAATGQVPGDGPALPQVSIDGGQVTVRGPATLALTQELRELNGDSITWDPGARAHRLPAAVSVHVAAELAVRHKLTTDQQIAGQIALHRLNAAESRMVSAAAVGIPGLAPGMAVMAQQFPVVRFGLRNNSFLLGDNVGWGKTVSALASVAVARALPVIVVCPSSLTLNWAREVGRFFPGWQVHVCSGGSPAPVLPGVQVVIIGTTALSARKDGVFPWVEVLGDLNAHALIVDESQEVKERKALRSQAVAQLAAPIRVRGGMCIIASGTAILNWVGELAHQLEVIGRIADFGGTQEFLRRYGRDDSDLLELNRRLCEWGIMIRRSDNRDLGLKPPEHHLVQISDTDIEPEVMARYRFVQARLVRHFAAEARAIAGKLGVNPDHPQVRAAMDSRSSAHLIKLNLLRQIIGEGKIPVITAWAWAQVQAGSKVVLAAHHRQVMDEYAAEWGGLTIRGGQTVASKEQHKARFQEEPLPAAPVMVLSIKAGGTGHTLTAAPVVAVTEYPWTPGDFDQVVGRVHRIGQARQVHAYRFMVEGTIDVKMEKLIKAKRNIRSAALDGIPLPGADPDDELSAVAEVAWEYVQEGLAADRVLVPA